MDVLEAFTFCPRCKHELILAGNLVKCPNCKLHYYDNPRPCSSVILKNEKGEILLLKRAFEPKKGFWNLPGGFIEKNETIEEGAIREIMEEAGVRVEKLEYLGSDSDTYLYKGLNYATLGTSFLGSVKSSDKIIPADDADDYKFFTLEDLPFEKLAFAAERQMLEDYKKSLT
jgi:NAD+ diphosphatase